MLQLCNRVHFVHIKCCLCYIGKLQQYDLHSGICTQQYKKNHHCMLNAVVNNFLFIWRRSELVIATATILSSRGLLHLRKTLAKITTGYQPPGCSTMPCCLELTLLGPMACVCVYIVPSSLFHPRLREPGYKALPRLSILPLPPRPAWV